MTGGTDLVALRQLVESVVVPGLTGYTHAMLSEAGGRLGLPEPPSEGEGTKRERINTSFAALTGLQLGYLVGLGATTVDDDDRSSAWRRWRT